jgi:phage terminase small subunit
MNVSQLLEWQWRGYGRYHQDRTNLLLHIIAVPVFMLASGLMVVGALRLSLPLLTAGVVGLVLSVVIQGRGHRMEMVPPEPFAGTANFVGRLLAEQWVTFPRFVLSGAWWANLTRAGKT